MCAIGAVAFYIVKGSSVKSKKDETIKNKFSVILDCKFESFKYYEGMKHNGTIYEEYIS